ncbi:MAG: hypothetical protein SFV81_25570 [Pirellulaceae bacterium]|nr:hypothetical protein [Pirellulaceae bacterium]
MYRPLLITGLLLAPLGAAFSGCSGSAEVAQSTPAPAVAPSSSSSSSSSGDSGSQSSTIAPPDDSDGSGAVMDQPTEEESMPGPTGGPAGNVGYGSGSSGPPGGMPGATQPGMPAEFDMGSGSGAGSGAGVPPGMSGAAGYPNMSAMGGNMAAMPGMGMPSEMGMGGMGGAGMGGMAGMAGMGGGQFAPPEDPAPAEDADYLTKGRYAFSIGKEKEAIEYARAFAIAAPEGTDVLQKTKWFAAGLRPITTARFAVGVVLEAPATMTDFKPIGSKQLQGGGGGGGGRDSMMMAPGSSGSGQNNKANAKKEHAIYDLTGGFGEAVIAGFKERWTAGNFGGVFNDVEKFVPPTPVGNNNGMAGMGMAGMGMAGMGMAGMRGGPPAGMDGMGMGGEAGMGMGGEGSSGPQERIMPGSVVIPGMVYIGSSEKQADLMKKAEERGVDLVVLFDVKVSPPNRLNGIVQNEAKVRVVSMKGEPLARSNELLNTEVERALMRANGEDEVAKATEKFFAQFDSKVKIGDMPALKPEHAKARLVQVLANTKLGKLEKLFEVSLYHSMKLITDEDKLTACLIVMEGSEGESVANGRPEDKQAVLDALLPNYK